MNNVTLMGRLTKDPEVVIPQDDTGYSRARYILAVKKRKKDEAAFIPCVAFGKTAEFVQKYLKKGKEIAITGHLDTNSYDDRNGNRVFSMNVIVDEHHFTGAPDPSSREASTQTDPDGFMRLPEGTQEELPFA